MRLQQEQEPRKFASAKNHIDNLLERRKKDDENSTSLTHDIECQIETALKGEQKIFFELMQNADDIEATEVSLYLLDSHLVIVHNGLPFSESDVEKICDIAQQRYHDKSNVQGKTGYKGIGFKAIFSIADRVQIISGEGDYEYSFRFDKKYFSATRTPSAAFPWPIIPIWTTAENDALEYKPHKLVHIMKERGNKTCIIATLKAGAKAGLAQDLNLMKSDPKCLLFLRSLQKVDFIDADEITIEKRKGMGAGNYLYTDLFIKSGRNVSWKLLSTWMSYTAKIEGEVLEKVKSDIKKANLSDYECPQRIRNTVESKLTFAVQVQYGQIITVKGPLFSYLPTRVHTDIPFVVNADFLLNAERTQLTENPWNEMIIFYVAYHAFILMQELTKNEQYRSQVLWLMPPNTAGMSLPTNLRKKYEEGFQKGVVDVNFVPENGTNELLYLRGSCFDETGFFKAFPDVYLPNRLVDYSVENIAPIPYISRFDASRLVSKLYEYAITNKSIDFQKRLVKFLYEYSRLNQYLMYSLKSCSFLLSSQNEVVKPQSAYFPETMVLSDSFPVKIHFIRPEIYDNNSMIKKWLGEVGVNVLTQIEFIRIHLLPMISKGDLESRYLLSVTTIIKRHFDCLSANDKQALDKLSVLNQGGNYIPLAVAYLSNIYGPRHKVENDVTNVDRFVSSEYLGGDFSQENIASWKRFWTELGVSEIIMGKAITVQYRWAELLYHDIGKMYECNMNRLFQVQQFRYVDFIQLINNKEHHDAIWAAIGGAYSNTYMFVSGGVDSIRHFLMANEVCEDDAGKFRRSSELFSKKLAPIVHGINPIVNFPILLSESVEAHLQIKVRMYSADCLNILSVLSTNKVNDNRYYYTFLALLNLLKEVNGDLKQSFKTDLRERLILLPSENGALRPISDLKFFNIKGANIGNSSRWFKHYVDILYEDRLKLAEILGLEVVDCDNLKVRTIPLASSRSDAIDIKEKFSQYLPLIAYCSTESQGHVAEKFGELQERLKPLEFVAVSLISLEHDGVELQSTPCYKKGDTIYYLNAISDIRTNREFCRMIGKVFKLTKKAKAILPWVTCLSHDQLLIQLESEQYDLEAVKEVIASYVPQKPAEVRLPQPSLVPLVDAQMKGKSDDSQLIRKVEQLTLNEPSQNPKNIAHLAFLATTKEVDVANIKLETSPLDLQPRVVMDDEQLSLPEMPIEAGNFQSNTGVSSRSRAEHDIDKNKATGDWGEKLVYKWLKNKYRAKLSCKYNGFEIKPFERNSLNFGFLLKPKESVSSDIEVTICWNNKPYYKSRMDSGQSFDFSITKKSGDTVKKRIIEVKTTTSHSSADLYISGRELSMMVKYGAKCRLFRVYGAGSQHPKIAILKDPAKVVNAGNHNISKVVIKM